MSSRNAFSIMGLGLGLAVPAFGQAVAEPRNPGTEGRELPADPAKHAPAVDEFAQIDANHDGRVSADEYAASPQSAVDRIAVGKRNGPSAVTGGFDLARNEGRPERSRYFKALDADKDGYLSREELGITSPPTGTEQKD